MVVRTAAALQGIKGKEVMMKKRKKKILRIILGLEILAAAGLFLLVILRGDISFHTIGAKETLLETSDGTAPEGEADTGGTSGMTDGRTDGKVPADSDETGENGAGANEGRNPADGTGQAGDQSDITVGQKDSGKNDGSRGADSKDSADTKEDNQQEEDLLNTITISVAGDVTLGRDLNYGYENSFDHEFERQGGDYSYFFRNVKDIFEQDDLTIVNLETTMTTATKPAEKKFRFKADPSYVEILKQGDIETVSIANNHTRDYLERGYKDTLATLEEAGVGYFGYEYTELQEVRGIKIGLAGLVAWDATKDKKAEISRRITELKEEGADIVILMFHWGIERDYYPSAYQTELAHYSIDQGADLVLGSHPHVLQGIEEYKGKQIVYSLGNFCFGGNKNPSDKDSMIYVHKFHFKNKELIGEEKEIIPCSISSVKTRNNYQPTPLEGEEKERVLDKIAKYSKF